MTVSIFCDCGFGHEAPEEDAGLMWACPGCGREWVVPQAGPTEAIFYIGPETGTNYKSLLINCLVFLCFVGVLYGLLLPVKTTHDTLNGQKICSNNLKNIVLALHHVAVIRNQGHFPPAAITDKNGKPLLSWRVAVLPYLDNVELYQQFHLDEPWDSPHNLSLLKEMPQILRCPNDPKPIEGMTNYQVIVGPNTLFTPDFKPVAIADIPDGLSRTFLVRESPRKVPWTKPEDLPIDINMPLHGLGNHDGFNMGYADGHMRYFSNAIDRVVLNALLTRNGHEDVSMLGE